MRSVHARVGGVGGWRVALVAALAAASAGNARAAGDQSGAGAADGAAAVVQDAGRAGEDAALAPTGALVDDGPLRPTPKRGARVVRACSFRLPICVHGAHGPEVLGVLDATERAWDVATGVLALPAPDPDIDTGAYDVYLVDDALPDDAVTALSTRDPRSRFARASAFTLLDARVARASGVDRPALRADAPSCTLDRTMARAVTRASLFRVAPATDEGTARAQTAYLARLIAPPPCSLGDVGDIDVFQAHPDRAFVDPWLEADPRAALRFDRGAQLFWWWLDSFYGALPGAMVRAVWALTPTITEPDAARWNAEPDSHDVLRMTFKDALTSGSKVEDLYVEFGVTRALVGARDNGAELVEARALGAAIVPPLDWTVDWPVKPRRLASPAPLAPTGSSYILVRRDGARPGARLRLEASWETNASIRWTVVKLDPQMRELGRIQVGAPPRATEAQMTVANLDDAASLLVVATNVGDPLAPFDPDDATFEPHGWLLTLAEE